MAAVIPLDALRSASRSRSGDDHPEWCVHHSSHGCIGAPFTLPGSNLRVWLSAPTAGDARLIVDGPGGYIELPVVA